LYLAASPTQTVETSGRMCLIVSNIAMPKKKEAQKKGTERERERE